MATPNEMFPCDVTGPDGTIWLTCQVRVSPYGTTVWAWSEEAQTGQAVIVSSQKPVERAENADQWTVAVEGGGEAYIIKRDHCGCGHPMRRWVPPGPSQVGT